jgi:hypothetical protein
LRGNVEKSFYIRFFGGFGDVEVEGGRIADDNQINFIALQVSSYALYKFVKEADLGEGVVEHCGTGGGGFEEGASSGSHFPAADADKVDIVSALFQGGYEGGAMCVGARLGGAYEDAVNAIFSWHKYSYYRDLAGLGKSLPGRRREIFHKHVKLRSNA